MTDYNIIRSISGYHKDCGYPLGQILCKKEYTKEFLEMTEIHDPILEEYLPPIKIIADNPEEQNIADQMAILYNQNRSDFTVNFKPEECDGNV